MMSLATATLLAEGIANPRDHLFLASGKRLATLVLSRAPFTPDEVAALSAATTGLGFHVIVSPGQAVASPALAVITGATDRATLDALSSAYALDMSPSTDERPFFFNQLRLTNPGAWSLAMASPDGVARGNLLATVTLSLIVVLSAILVAATILGPSLGAVRQVAPAFAFYGTSYFLLIGLGFMFVEMGLIERLSVYLGHPVYGLAIGLGGIILSTGCGSLLAAKIKLSSAPRLALWAGLLALYLALLPFWLGALVAHYAAADLGMRVAISLLAIVPPGLLMGWGFPTGMEMANAVSARPTPWFWAVNGAAGVLAAGLAVAVSIAASISMTLWVGAACYALLAPVGMGLRRLGEQHRYGAVIPGALFE